MTDRGRTLMQLDRRTVLSLGLRGAALALVDLARSRVARAQATAPLHDPRERRLANVRQLTFGGSNAEAYFDQTGTRLIFQSTRPPFGCDQIFTMRVDGTDVRLASTGQGRTTCGYFFPDSLDARPRFIYASTHLAAAECPSPPDRSHGYVWPIYRSYDIFSADVSSGTTTLRRLTDSDGYDAEGVIAPDGRRIVFTSLRAGDLDIYTMAADGTDVRRLTDTPGYDGGAFFSWDGKWIVFRASRPETAEELAEYRALLAQGLVRPSRLEIFVMKADGTGVTQVTRKRAASFAPFMLPGSQQIVFSSNLHDPTGRTFALHLVNVDGSGLERVTYADSFASFPMLSRDGTKLVFCSNRNASSAHEMNVFVADWVA